MAYRLKADRPVTAEVMRIVDKQLGLALRALGGLTGRRTDQALHEARRHVKKVRAAIRLAAPALGGVYGRVNAEMHTAIELLAPVADAEALVEIVDRLGGRCGPTLPPRTIALLRVAFLARATDIDRQVRHDRVLEEVARILRAERQRIPEWTWHASGFRAIAPGLEKSFRRARNATRHALDRPTSCSYRVWRPRVKDLWLQVRLLERRCGTHLGSDQLALEALDGSLGEHHNVSLLQQRLIADALVSRADTARCLRMLRTYRAGLRREATTAARLFDETPGEFVCRVKQLWHSSRAGRRSTPMSVSCVP